MRKVEISRDGATYLLHVDGGAESFDSINSLLESAIEHLSGELVSVPFVVVRAKRGQGDVVLWSERSSPEEVLRWVSELQ